MSTGADRLKTGVYAPCFSYSTLEGIFETRGFFARNETMAMKVEYVNPFIEAVYDLFSTMLSSSISRGDVDVTTEDPGPRDVMALIGLSGPAKGMVALAFPSDTAIKMMNRLLGTETEEMDDSVCDAVAEIVNIVAGGAKAKFPSETGEPIQLSLPTVVRGTHYNVDYPSDSMWLEVPFTSDLGPFSMRVTFVIEDGSA